MVDPQRLVLAARQVTFFQNNCCKLYIANHSSSVSQGEAFVHANRFSRVTTAAYRNRVSTIRSPLTLEQRSKNITINFDLTLSKCVRMTIFRQQPNSIAQFLSNLLGNQ